MSWSNNWFQPPPPPHSGPCPTPGPCRHPNPPHTSMPFWDFVRGLDPAQVPGAGVDYHAAAAGFPFQWAGGAGQPWDDIAPGADRGRAFPHRFRGGGFGRRGGHGGGCRRRHSHHESGNDEASEARGEASERDDDAVMVSDNDKDSSPETLRGDQPSDEKPPAEDEPQPPRSPRGPPHHHGHGRHGPHHHGPGPQRHGPGFGGRRGGPGGGRRHHGPPDGERFDFNFAHPGFAGGPLNHHFRGFVSHLYAQALRRYTDRVHSAENNNSGAEDVFVPPVDIFNTERAYVLHVALPGARKEDVGVDWDADRNNLRVAGVVHRPGDEAFLATLASGERRVGMFERDVTLPPPEAAGAREDGEREEIDGQGITARMEDGVLIIVVPKVEKEWTEVRKVDIE